MSRYMEAACISDLVSVWSCLARIMQSEALYLRYLLNKTLTEPRVCLDMVKESNTDPSSSIQVYLAIARFT